jgi:signal recognition particle subunit SRP19
MKRIVLWPSYFDSKLSKKMGRRVLKSVGVERPTVEELASAAHELGLEPEIDHSKRFPSAPWAKGCVYVSKRYPKQETIRKVGVLLKGVRGDQKPQS